MKTVSSNPAPANGRPTRAKSNMPNGAAPYWFRKSARITFGGVPIKVTRPPSNEAKVIGMRIRLGETRAERQAERAAGSSSACAPKLFMKADATPHDILRRLVPSGLYQAVQNPHLSGER